MTEIIDDCVYYCASYNQQFENQEINNNMKNLILIIATFVLMSATITGDKKMPSAELKTLEGKTVNIKDYLGKGKPVVVSFWATWCSPCKKELDAINDVYPEWVEDYGVELLAITIDNARGMAKVPGMVGSKGWEYTVLSDSKQTLQQALNFQTIPQTFLVDGEGNIVYTHNGYNPGDEYELEDKIAALMKR